MFCVDGSVWWCVTVECFCVCLCLCVSGGFRGKEGGWRWTETGTERVSGLFHKTVVRLKARKMSEWFIKDLPCDSVAKTPHPQCWGLEFNPRSGN